MLETGVGLGMHQVNTPGKYTCKAGELRTSIVMWHLDDSGGKLHEDNDGMFSIKHLYTMHHRTSIFYSVYLKLFVLNPIHVSVRLIAKSYVMMAVTHKVCMKLCLSCLLGSTNQFRYNYSNNVMRRAAYIILMLHYVTIIALQLYEDKNSILQEYSQ